MTAKKYTNSDELPRPQLLILKSEAKQKIEERIKSGRQLLITEITNDNQLEAARANRSK